MSRLHCLLGLRSVDGNQKRKSPGVAPRKPVSNFSLSEFFCRKIPLDELVTTSYESIRIGNVANDNDEDPFESAAREALALIQEKDPGAWRLVKREVSYLINARLVASGGHYSSSRMCAVDFEQCYKNKFTGDLHGYYHDWYIASLASTIVHEATHGRLYSFGIPYIKRTRERVERLCRARERRFVARLHSEHYDLMRVAPPYKAADWHPYWHYGKRLASFPGLLKRILRDS